MTTAVVVNGAERDVEDGTTLADLVGALSGDATGCAVAVNDEVVTRAQWPARPIESGDRIEVLTAVQGG
jgi:sulfur carrier protein